MVGDPFEVGDAGVDAGKAFLRRLQEVIDDFPDRQSAAKAAGVNADQLARYIRGATKPGFDAVARLALARDFSLNWLSNDIGPKRISADDPGSADMVMIPVLDVRAGAGSEQFVIDESPISALPLPRSYLIGHGIRPQHARLMFGIGNSMAPTILNRSPLVVDTSDLGERDDVYVMRRGDGIIVKRLQHMADGSIMLKSDNPAYAPDKLPRDEADELRVIGRVGLVLQEI